MKNSPFRTALILLVTLVSMFMVLPNFLDDDTLAGWPDFLPKEKIVLGLDLQGGAHLLLQVNREDIVEGRLSDLRRDARSILVNQGIGNIITTRGTVLDIQLTDASQRDQARQL